jgi:diguanylate cyclase (GGDEF)-like protein/PAS domain S-box-containing protein
VPDTLSAGTSRWPIAAVRALIEGLADGVVVIDATGSVLLHNQAAATLFGVPNGEMVGETMLGQRDAAETWAFRDAGGSLLVGEDHPLVAARLGAAPVTRRSIGVSRQGTANRWVHLAVRPLGRMGHRSEVFAVVFERAPDPRASRSLQTLALDLAAQHPLDGLFAQQAVGVLQFAPDGVIARVNDAFAAMVGVDAAELPGQLLPELIDADDLRREDRAMRRLTGGGADAHTCEIRLLRRDGTRTPVQVGVSALRNAEGVCEALLAQVIDVSRLRRAEDFMSRRALFDPLTQLINRTLLIDLLGDQLRVRQHPLAVIALNLDRFKAVNDSLGQSTGDGVLVEIADRLRGLLQAGDAAARIAGDDFVLLCGGARSREAAEALTQRVLDAVAEPIDVAGLRIQLTASAGVTVIAPRSGLSGDDVLTQATQALKVAKEKGRARWKVFDTEMRSASTDRLRIETSLRAALEEGQLRVAYQPLLDLRSGRTVGAEALLRWDDPVLGEIAPPAFLPVAEETGLIVPLGEFVLRESVATVSRWRELTGHDLYVSVNLSPNELNRPGIGQRVAEVLEEAGLPASALRLEITESVLVDADAQVKANLTALVERGVSVGIDDFGTGYASMSYLKNLPIDFVKVDQSFVDGLITSREDRAIVRATIELAKSLGLLTIAEGVEDQAQLEALRELGCDVGQGFHIGRPAEPARMLERFAS